MDNNITQTILLMSESKLNYYIIFTTLSIILSAIGIMISIRYNRKQLQNSAELQKKQLKINFNWNRRQLAMTESMRIMKEIREIHEKHDKILKYTERKISEPYLLDADDKKTGIHDLILETDNNGKRTKNSAGYFILSKEGRVLSGAIKNILNNYEYLAAGISEQTFDEETIKRLNKSNMIKAYRVFELYVEHLRDFYKRPLLYIELQKIVEKWENEDKIKTNNRNKNEDE